MQEMTAKLLKKIVRTDELGQKISSGYEDREVYVCKRSVRQSEFYQAAQQGMKPDFVLEMSAFDYNEETLVELNGRKYTVYRTYERDDEQIELYCTVKSGDK